MTTEKMERREQKIAERAQRKAINRARRRKAEGERPVLTIVDELTEKPLMPSQIKMAEAIKNSKPGAILAHGRNRIANERQARIERRAEKEGITVEQAGMLTRMGR